MFRRSLSFQCARLSVEIRFRDVRIFALCDLDSFGFGLEEVFNYGLSLRIIVLAVRRTSFASKTLICRNQRKYVVAQSSNFLEKLHLQICLRVRFELGRIQDWLGRNG